MRDNCFLQQKKGPLYPNIYVLLVADSAVSRKDTPLGIAYDMMTQVKNTKLIRGRASIQAILDDLGMVDMDRKTGVSITGGSALICAPELSAFFVDDAQVVKIMTDIYDYRQEYAVSLKGTGKKIIKNVCICLLAASNETLLREVYNNVAIYGGLMGRTFFVKPDERRPANSLFVTGPNGDDAAELQKVLDSLSAISKLKGQFNVEQEARLEYTSWYEQLYQSYTTKLDKSGVIPRIHTGVLKIAMVLAVGHRHELNIRKEDIEEAIDRCTKLLPNYEMFAMTSGKSTIAAAGSIFLTELWDSPQKSISRKWFTRKYWTDIDAKTLDDLVTALESGGLIRSDIVIGTVDIMYSLTELGMKQFKEKMGS